jgi:MFS family permease
VADGPSSGDDAAIRKRSLIAIYAAAAAFAFTFGLTTPLLSVVLESRGANGIAIGLNGAMPALGILVSAPMVPLAIRKAGTVPFMLGSIAVAGATIALLRATDHLALWMILRFLYGMAINGLLMVSETWINRIVTPETRGRAIALYATAFAAAFAAGPILVATLPPDSWTPYLIAIGVLAATAVPLGAIRRSAPDFGARPTAHLLAYFRVAPALLAAVIVLSFIDGAVVVHLIVYAIRQGADLAAAAGMVSAFVLGNIALQLPIGWLADRFDKGKVLAGCAAAGLAGSVALPFVVTAGQAVAWPVLVAWGGFSYGLYTVALAGVGERFAGVNLIGANAAVAVTWGLGGIIGPALAGTALDVSGRLRLPAALATACVMLQARISL